MLKDIIETFQKIYDMYGDINVTIGTKKGWIPCENIYVKKDAKTGKPDFVCLSLIDPGELRERLPDAKYLNKTGEPDDIVFGK